MTLRKCWCLGLAALWTAWGCGGAPTQDADPSSSSSSSDEYDPETYDGSIEPEETDDEMAGIDADDEPSPSQESEHEELARYLMTRPGKRIGFAAGSEQFAITEEILSGASTSLAVVFVDKDGSEKARVAVCAAAVCDEQLEQRAEEELPGLAEKLSAEGFVAIKGRGWPSNDELVLGAMGTKLTRKQNRFYAEPEEGGAKKPVFTMPQGKTTVLALYPVDDARLIGIYVASNDIGSDREFGVLAIP